MDTEIKKKDIYYIGHIASAKANISVDGDVIVPDVNPDAVCILSLNAQPKVTGRELQNDRILIYGSMDYKIIYSTEENITESIKCTSSFTDVIDLPGAAPGMEVSLDYSLKDSECRILNGRKLSLKSVVNVDIDVYNRQELSLVYDLVSTDTEKKFAQFSFLSPKTDFEKIFEVNDRAEIPIDKISASEILDTISSISDKSVRVINNKVIVKGEVTTDIIYKETESDEIRQLTKVTPFTEIFDVDGIREDSFSYTDISVCSTKCACDQLAIRDFEICTELKGRVYCYINDTVTLVDDCYSITSNCDMKRENIPFRVPLKSFSGQLSLKEGVDNGSKISSVLNVSASAENESINITDGKIIFKGNVNVKALCICTDTNQPLTTVKKTIPFSYSADCSTVIQNTECDAFCEATGPSYTLNSDGSIEIRCNVSVSGIVYTTKETGLITDITFEERGKQNDIASITVYFVQENDDLWSVAKKYLTSIDKVKALNKMESDVLKKGMKLFIPKHKIEVDTALK